MATTKLRVKKEQPKVSLSTKIGAAAASKSNSSNSMFNYGDIYTGPRDSNPGILKARDNKRKIDSVLNEYKSGKKKLPK